MSNQSVTASVEAWISAWNSRDLEAIMSHYAEDVVFEAQTVAKRWNKPNGKLYGREELRKHFELGLQLAPQIHFTLEQIFLAPSGYSVVYARENGNRVVDSVRLDSDGLAKDVVAYYAAKQD